MVNLPVLRSGQRGVVASVHLGVHDHGNTSSCAPAVQAGGPGRRSTDLAVVSVPAAGSYFLVTAHVDDVESPAGYGSDAVEIDRSQSICK